MVLFHVTADTRWSDLPLSGAFVDMLRAHRRALAGSSAAAERQRRGKRSSRQPRGTGRAADPRARRLRRLLHRRRRRRAPFPPISPNAASLDHPPGFYGPPEGLVAVNTLAPADRPAPLDASSLNARLDVYRHGEPLDLRGPIFLAALALLVLDALVVIWLSGGLSSLRPRRRAVSALIAFGLLCGLGVPQDLAQAQSPPRQPPLIGRNAYAADPDTIASSGPERDRRRIRPEGNAADHTSLMSSPATPRSTRSARTGCKA